MNTLLLPTVHDSALFFRPFIHSKLSLSGRLVMLPPPLPTMHGAPLAGAALHYKSHATSSTALIITEPLFVNAPGAPTGEKAAIFYGGNALRTWKSICRAVHATHCKIAPQLTHAPHPQGITALSKSQMQEISQAFARAAAHAQAIGADAVEIQGGKGGLIEQFLREESNQRTDEYGGDPTRRARFVCEILHAVRKAVGRNFPIIFALSQWDIRGTAPLVNNAHELEELLQALCAAGVDMFHCNTHNHVRPAFSGSPLSMAGWVRLLTHKPTIGELNTEGSQTTPLLPHMLRLLRSAEVDLLAPGSAFFSKQWL